MQRVMLAIPLEHAKTTLSKLAVVWYFRYTNHRFCVYLSTTNTLAKNACKDIIGYLKSPNSIAVFGEIKMIKESETDSLCIFELTTPEGREIGRAHVCTPVTNAHLVCCILLENKNIQNTHTLTTRPTCHHIH